MKISDLSLSSLAYKLKHEGLKLITPPFVVDIRSDCPALARDLHLAYADFRWADTPIFCDFHLEIKQEFNPGNWLQPLARFYFDGRPSFVPLPGRQAFTMFEWGLNWCIAAHCHDYLIIHAAVIERDGRAALLPAPPGSGKSTLCAALVNNGWRLLSDELALLSMKTNQVFGMARPVNLKNASIDIIKNFATQAQFTEIVPDTTKGTIALMRPPAESVDRAQEPAEPCWVILPQYSAGAPACLETANPVETFMLLAEQSFNYDIHGEAGFHRIGKLLDECSCHRFTYSSLDDAISLFERMFEETR